MLSGPFLRCFWVSTGNSLWMMWGDGGDALPWLAGFCRGDALSACALVVPFSHALDLLSGPALALALGPCENRHVINSHAHSASEVEEPILPQPLTFTLNKLSWGVCTCVCACLFMSGETHVSQHVCGGQGTTLHNCFSPSSLPMFQGIKHKLRAPNVPWCAKPCPQHSQ